MQNDGSATTKEQLVDAQAVLGTFVHKLEQRFGKDSPQVKKAQEELSKLTQLAMGV